MFYFYQVLINFEDTLSLDNKSLKVLLRFAEHHSAAHLFRILIGLWLNVVNGAIDFFANNFLAQELASFKQIWNIVKWIVLLVRLLDKVFEVAKTRRRVQKLVKNKYKK